MKPLSARVAEFWNPTVQTHAGASSRIDFVLPQFRLAAELKYTRESLRAKSWARS
jgi:hypothetical protein